MVAITTDGTQFGCAGISLTESGIAVLSEGGSRLGFVPYGSLQYVTPCVEDQGAEDGTGLGGDLEVVAADGSAFSCASLSQTAAGVATLAPSGERTGFVPYDTLEYVLPEGETGDASVDCSLPPGVAGAAEAVEQPAAETAEGPEEDEPAEEADEPTEASEEEGVWEDAEDQAGSDASAASESTTDADDEEDGLWEEAEESTDQVDPEAPVVEEESGEAATDATTDETADVDGEAPADAGAESETTTEGDSQRAEREAAGESEMQVEWSFGEYDE